jgi:double zinc ribbon protein
MSPVHAIFGIEPGTLNTIVQLVLLAVVVVWLSLVWYTFADARRRLDDDLLVASAVLASLLFPFLGTIVYMIVRPPEYLEDVRERELEMEAAQARLMSLEYQLCPHCDAAVGRDFLRCPHCLRKLRDTCASCSRPLDPDWMICPYCEAEIPGVTPQRRSRRRRADESEPPPGEDGQDTVTYDALTEAPAQSEHGETPVYGEHGETPGYGEHSTTNSHGEESASAEPAYGEPEGSRYEDTVVSQAPPGDSGLEAGTPSELPPGYGQPRQH